MPRRTLFAFVASTVFLCPLQASAFDPADGVSKSEAQFIADELFGQLVGCGASGEARRDGDHWSVPTKLGYAGRPGPPLLVDASTGSISWGDRCHVPDPSLLLTAPESIECEVPPPAA